MINSVIHHIGIGVLNPEPAVCFYDLLLVEWLGMTKEMDLVNAKGGWKGRGSRIYLYSVELGSPPGALQHLAFTAKTRDEVDRFPAWAAQKQIETIEGPGEYPEDGRDYYAVFFRGPEGMKLELVHLSEMDGADPL